MTTTDLDILLTPQELAERWHVSQKTLANQRSNGTGVPYIKIGASVGYHLDDVTAYEIRVAAG